MIVADILTYSRSLYNATGDTFFTDLEIYFLIYKAELELCNECNLIESIDSTTLTVSGTNSYNYPTNARIIKRLTYTNLVGIANKLEPITFREDDALTLVNVASTTLGTPQFYTIYNSKIYLRPTPDTSACTVTFYTYNEPIPVTAVSTLEIPTVFHADLVDYVLMNMYLKDKDVNSASAYKGSWDLTKARIKRWVQKRKRGDAFTVVQNEDNLAVTLSGPV